MMFCCLVAWRFKEWRSGRVQCVGMRMSEAKVGRVHARIRMTLAAEMKGPRDTETTSEWPAQISRPDSAGGAGMQTLSYTRRHPPPRARPTQPARRDAAVNVVRCCLLTSSEWAGAVLAMSPRCSLQRQTLQRAVSSAACGLDRLAPPWPEIGSVRCCCLASPDVTVNNAFY